MTQQIIICGSEAQRERAAQLFPKLESRYVNGGDWSSIEGCRCVCLGDALAHFAQGYASEVKILPDEIPDEILTPADAMAWAKANAVTYAQNPAPQVAAASPSSEDQAAGNDEDGTDVPPAHPAPVASGPSESDAEPPPSHDTDFPPDALETRPDAPRWVPPEAADMGKPADLWGHDEVLPEMPAECYPEALRAYIQDEAEMMGCDPGMLSIYCTAICAGTLTDAIRVQVKAISDRWQEPGRVWAMIVGDSGLTMKSPTLDIAISHAWKIERELRLKGSEVAKEYATECAIYEAQKAEYIKTRAKGNPAQAPNEPLPPISERLIVGNATLEAVADVLLQQGERGVMVLADELLGIISGMNQYKGGKGSDRQDWLEMWNGGPHTIDRKGRAVLIKNWGVSLIGGTQPNAISRVSTDLESDGLLQRFTVYLPRYSVRGMDKQSDHTARKRYHAVLDRLHTMVPSPDLMPVRFSPDAAKVMEEAREWIMETTRASWLSAGLRAHLAKWPAILARLCLTYAAIEAADEQHAAIPPTISADIARQVWGMMSEILWPHAQHFYMTVLANDSPDRAAVRQIAGLILADGMLEIDARTFTRRSSLYRAAVPSKRREIISSLCELCWMHPKGGRSLITGLPTHYKVNPAVHEMFKDTAEMERKERAARTKSWAEKREAKAAEREPGQD